MKEVQCLHKLYLVLDHLIFQEQSLFEIVESLVYLHDVSGVEF